MNQPGRIVAKTMIRPSFFSRELGPSRRRGHGRMLFLLPHLRHFVRILDSFVTVLGRAHVFLVHHQASGVRQPAELVTASIDVESVG